MSVVFSKKECLKKELDKKEERRKKKKHCKREKSKTGARRRVAQNSLTKNKWRKKMDLLSCLLSFCSLTINNKKLSYTETVVVQNDLKMNSKTSIQREIKFLFVHSTQEKKHWIIFYFFTNNLFFEPKLTPQISKFMT